jgi:hypothetical protein
MYETYPGHSNGTYIKSQTAMKDDYSGKRVTLCNADAMVSLSLS